MTFSTATLDMPTGYKAIDPQMRFTYHNIQPLTVHRDFIYAIMVCERMGVKNFLPDLGSSRLIGWYGAYETAVSSVTKYLCGFDKCYYNYVLIEKVEEGLYMPTNSSERWWFKYDHETDTCAPVEEPQEYKYYSGFTIG